jgi:glyoxylase-like metal-dependent hydrolase (beta-lactamase superfamily II)
MGQSAQHTAESTRPRRRMAPPVRGRAGGRTRRREPGDLGWRRVVQGGASAAPVELADGVHRVTFPLPFGIDHVHCYLLRDGDGDGTWTLVDTSIGVPDAEHAWAPVLAALDGPVERIVVTHFHPDHVGGSADVASLTGGSVFQGRLDYEDCLRVWVDEATPQRLREHLLAHGVSAEEAEEQQFGTAGLRSLVNFAREPERLEAGDRLAGWEVLHLPGHADGHLVLLRDGVLIAGDTILDPITPVVGLYPDSRPDPLGDYLESLERIAVLAPRIALAGHGRPIEDPAGRARAILEHHRARLDRTAAALGATARTAYDVSHDLFPGELPGGQRRFAVVEALAHLEHLVRAGRASRVEEPGRVAYVPG